MNCESFQCDLFSARGRIEMILGPMFSGKTTELMRRITRFRLAHFRCIIFKYAGDVRYSENDISTHDLRSLPAISCSKLGDHVATALEQDVVGIDEGQFFPDLVEFAEELANEGKILIVAALDGTFQRAAFGEVLNLIPLAENVVKLSAICMSCYKSASFTKRITKDKALEVIGGPDKYMAVCRNCYHRNDRVKSPLKERNGNISYERNAVVDSTENRL